MEEDSYKSFAEIYDLFYSSRVEDIDFYAGLAERYGDPILELGCGTGRVLIPLARRGYRIVGIDNSESMLTLLRKKLEKEAKDVRKRVEIIKADMRNFSLGKEFKLIIIPFSSIVHLKTLDDALSTFTNVFNHLNNKGAFAFDVFIPSHEYIVKKSRISFYTLDIDESRKLILWERAKYDPTNQYIYVDRLVEIVSGNDSKKYFWKYTLRWYTKPEIELLLRLAGFKKIEVYGDFNFGEYGYEKGLMVFLAFKKE